MHMPYTLWYKSCAHFAKRLKSQDEELEHFHALEKERREHDLLPIRPRGVALQGGWHSQGVAGGETS